MSTPIDSQSLDTLFRQARTYSYWLPKPVPDELLKSVYDLFKFGPTSANGSPGRIVFVKSAEAKERLRPALAPLNVEKTMAAPATAIVAYDLEFYEKLPKLFPQADARAWFVGNTKMIQENAFRNGSLQGAYFILAARALGLDCGPMSGFDPAKVDAAFFPDGKWKSNFLVNIGYGDSAKLYPRNPRLDFEEACRIE
jgi:3-hydroxypropanoate dehydrogenase